MPEVLDCFGLPDSFPQELMPVPIAQWVHDHHDKQEPLAALIASAEANGFGPVICQPLPHLGEKVYGFGLDFAGLQVPLMARMKEVP